MKNDRVAVQDRPKRRPRLIRKQWKVGSGLKNLSDGSSTTWAEICSIFAMMFRCERTTPLGAPSVPDVEQNDAGVVPVPSRSECLRQERPRDRERFIDGFDFRANVFEIYNVQ